MTQPDRTSDAQLVAAILLAGDGPEREGAYRLLLERYWKVVVALMQSRTACLRDAEEVTQEAFVKAWSCIDRLDDPRRFLGWLLRIARNIATDRVRANRRYERLDEPELAGLGAKQAGLKQESSTAIESVDTRDEWDRVRRTLEHLPEKYRDVITLRYLREMTNQEIARSLGEPEGTIRNRVFRALEKLRTALGQSIPTRQASAPTAPSAPSTPVNVDPLSPTERWQS